MSRIRILPLLAAALLGACNLMTDPAFDGVAYEADRREYTPQDSITTTLANTSDTDVGYNLCTSTLESRSGGAWTRVERNQQHPCTLPLFTLHPGESATYREPAS